MENTKYSESIQKAILYVESNLNKEIMLEDAAGAAGFSKYHFHRIFQALVGQSLADYVRRRRLTKASYDLLGTQAGILAIALDYQFESQESFTRAFKKMFGMNPGQYRKAKRRLQLKEEPVISEERIQHFYGGMPMEPRVTVRDSFKVVGMKVETKMADDKIPELWQKFIPRMNEIKHRMNNYDMYGISEYSDNYVDEWFTYWACVPVEHVDDIPAGMEIKTVSSAQYVVVTHKGKLDSMGNAFDYIHTSWLQNSGYELAESDGFELYGERFLGGDNEDSETDIYIAIKSCTPAQ
ncbi:AraC family transcriptional regulator [Cohnella panacarvi]|uniref:AraC family transcriptional regulator n=1 Tax=Cohnella panacarvi TaxID=400776 RepID=UPI000478D1F5|nr:AraC family transcriptional regulator [Cohnella panacarvi]